MPDPKPAYAIADKLVVAQGKDVRATLMTFEFGQEIPWHSHTHVTDSSFCLEGAVEIAFRGPDETRVLGCGEWLQATVGRAHRVRCLGPGPCRVLLVQGVGEYDFVPQPQTP
ncbi:hypothetical protein NNJEOMEG_00848 [Fundidesulfovibrio magnetotacticus]|uniref:Cupin type-2 domain-containing protein n=1 Tax=Fundidesulfovibrio magnetotacticus TaxID=2730080 RepID=A0A6V8LSE0_9BACT|nr:cupin domain-containing protein [Fundidesulfovibrio magnetotacticus]GFK93019.1 hypothetical protein NNJEOMEG_00848 [Fundidesulfovibrio magnetotacticus]